MGYRVISSPLGRIWLAFHTTPSSLTHTSFPHHPFSLFCIICTLKPSWRPSYHRKQILHEQLATPPRLSEVSQEVAGRIPGGMDEELEVKEENPREMQQLIWWPLWKKLDRCQKQRVWLLNRSIKEPKSGWQRFSTNKLLRQKRPFSTREIGSNTKMLLIWNHELLMAMALDWYLYSAIITSSYFDHHFKDMNLKVLNEKKNWNQKLKHLSAEEKIQCHKFPHQH